MGLSNPISISEYYRGGGYVPDTSMNEGVPTSGTISLSDFFGATLINLPGDAEYIDHPDGDGVWRYTATSDFTINVPGDISILMVGGGGRGQTGYAGSGPAGGAAGATPAGPGPGGDGGVGDSDWWTDGDAGRGVVDGDDVFVKNGIKKFDSLYSNSFKYNGK